jgi:hypothetical protein
MSPERLPETLTPDGKAPVIIFVLDSPELEL